MVGFTAALGSWSSGSRRWNTRRGTRAHALLLADLDSDLHGVPLGIPSSFLGKDELHDGCDPQFVFTGDVLSNIWT
jgi:hypothetical protein